MSKILDPWTRGYLTALGVGEGWRCLELGGGNGSIAEWLAATVGSAASVTAIDVNPVLLELIPGTEPVGTADGCSHGRATTEFLRLGHASRVAASDCRVRPDGARAMAAAVKSGGWLLVQEPDFHLAPTTEPEPWASTWKGLIEWGRINGVDWVIGRQLPSMVSALGLGHP
jgi:hypothetical protein